MIDPEKTKAAFDEWALNEIKSVSSRNFEMSKFLFGISVSTFAIPVFFGEKITAKNPLIAVGIIITALSAFLALWIAERADFELDQNTDVAAEHKKYARKGQDLRHIWFVVWLFGVVILFSGSGTAGDSVPTIPVGNRMLYSND